MKILQRRSKLIKRLHEVENKARELDRLNVILEKDHKEMTAREGMLFSETVSIWWHELEVEELKNIEKEYHLLIPQMDELLEYKAKYIAFVKNSKIRS